MTPNAEGEIMCIASPVCTNGDIQYSPAISSALEGTTSGDHVACSIHPSVPGSVKAATGVDCSVSGSPVAAKQPLNSARKNANKRKESIFLNAGSLQPEGLNGGGAVLDRAASRDKVAPSENLDHSRPVSQGESVTGCRQDECKAGSGARPLPGVNGVMGVGANGEILSRVEANGDLPVDAPDEDTEDEEMPWRRRVGKDSGGGGQGEVNGCTSTKVHANGIFNSDFVSGNAILGGRSGSSGKSLPSPGVGKDTFGALPEEGKYRDSMSSEGKGNDIETESIGSELQQELSCQSADEGTEVEDNRSKRRESKIDQAADSGGAEDLVPCPLCQDKFPRASLESHANACLDECQYSSLTNGEGEGAISPLGHSAGANGSASIALSGNAEATDGGGIKQGACPFCTKLYPIEKLDTHANSCLDDRLRKEEAEEKKAKRATRWGGSGFDLMYKAALPLCLRGLIWVVDEAKAF